MAGGVMWGAGRWDGVCFVFWGVVVAAGTSQRRLLLVVSSRHCRRWRESMIPVPIYVKLGFLVGALTLRGSSPFCI
jgi:hypothetical protein